MHTPRPSYRTKPCQIGGCPGLVPVDFVDGKVCVRCREAVGKLEWETPKALLARLDKVKVQEGRIKMALGLWI